MLYEKFYEEYTNQNGELKGRFTYNDNFNFAFDVLDELAKSSPDALALIHKSLHGHVTRFTFAQIAKESAKIANMLKADGIGKGDAVMLVMKRRYEFWFVMMALHRLGAVAIPTSHMVTGEDIESRLIRAGAKGIVILNDGYIVSEVSKVFENKELDAKVLKYNVGDELDGFKHLTKNAINFEDTIERPDNKATDPMLYYFTSGTSGAPKCVVHNYTYPLCHIVTAKNWHGVVKGGVHLTVADSGWAKFVWGKMYGQWIMETTVLCYDYEQFYAEEMLSLLSEMKVTTFCAPPTIYKYLVREDITKHDLSSLVQVVSAGEHLPEPVAEKFKQATGLEIREGFGQTETPCQIYTPVGCKQVAGSIGKASPVLNFKLVDEDNNEVKPGETGELCITKNEDGSIPIGIFSSYLDDKETYNQVWEGGIYHTNDRAYMNEEGYYFFVGRADDVIKSSGYRIGPSEVEDILLEHEAVKECAVTGYPSATRGELVKASIILENGYEKTPELKRTLQDFVKSRTALYKYPRVIEFVDDMPRSTSGKISRRLIRDNDLKKAQMK